MMLGALDRVAFHRHPQSPEISLGMIQRRRPGDSAGQERGRPVASFLHRHLREFPKSCNSSWSAYLRTIELSTHSCRGVRSEEHTSELQSLTNLVCRLLLEKKNTNPRPAPRQ